MGINRVKAEITSADISAMMRLLVESGIDLHNVKRTDDMTVSCYLQQSDFEVAERMLTRRGARIRAIERKGVLHLMANFLHRPILSIGVLLLIFLSVFLPTRILFVEIQGNTSLPARQILEQAERCGIRFGATRRTVRSEETKNQLLSAIPELQWAGINTRGCVATISVKEKNMQTEASSLKNEVSSIVARTDGIITNCTVQQGTALCKVGQAVRAGQVLVSGYTDCGLKIQALQADAEITAVTIRELEVITPGCYSKRGETDGSNMRISLLIGKKLINLFQGSGISGSTCVKMYEKKYMTLPGGRILPIALVIERCFFYEQTPAIISQDSAEGFLIAAANDYLSEQMIAGQVLHANVECCQTDDGITLSGRYICSEMIGQVIHEERIYKHGKDN